jgi:hypothetical protein
LIAQDEATDQLQSVAFSLCGSRHAAAYDEVVHVHVRRKRDASGAREPEQNFRTAGERPGPFPGSALALTFGQGGKAVGVQWAILVRFVRMGIESIQPPKPFQAEYEGSIPFTRSKQFRPSWFSIQTRALLP